jgi:magnesium transporter
MSNPLFASELRDLILQKDAQTLEEFCSASHPTIIAEFFEALATDEIRQGLNLLQPRLQAEIFSHLSLENQIRLAESLKRKDLAAIINHMSSDERVDFLKRLPDERKDALMPILAQVEREDIRRLSAYPEGTTGAMMTSEYATLSPNQTAAEAVDKLRREAPDKETIYYCYVVDVNRRLIGFISLKDLILARPDTPVEQIMHRDVIFAQVNDDQEATAEKIARYDLLAIPVVNGNGVVVGIITHDDAIDIIHQEHTEDMEKLMAIAGSHEANMYLKTSSWRHFMNRAGWIVVLALLGLVSGAIVQNYESLLVQFAILATFMPMLADTGGNTGSQSATLVVRALALGEIKPRDILKVLSREFIVALLLAALLGIFAFGRVIFFYPAGGLPGDITPAILGMTVALALGLQVITATLIGALLPIAAARMKLDPAVVASPALTTIVDITGLMIFFMTAKFFLGI